MVLVCVVVPVRVRVLVLIMLNLVDVFLFFFSAHVLFQNDQEEPAAANPEAEEVLEDGGEPGRQEGSVRGARNRATLSYIRRYMLRVCVFFTLT